DDQERGRIKTTIGDLKIRLERVLRPKDDATAMKEKEPEPKKPTVKVKSDSADERSMKLKMEAKDLYEKIKFSQDAGERKRLEQRLREIEQELKLQDQGTKMQINIKEVEVRLQSNPDDVPPLFDPP